MQFNEYDNDISDNDTPMSDPSAPDQPGMPIGVGSFSAEDGFTTNNQASGTKRHAGSALLLIAVVGLAVAGLFSMRTLTRASASSEGNAEVEQSIESFLETIDQSSGDADGTGRRRDADGNVLNVLNESYTERQVPLEDVQRNPFIIFEPTVTANDDDGTPTTPTDPREEQRRMRKGEIEQAAGNLQLRSVLMGRTPLATINSEVVRVDDDVTTSNGTTFTVQWIKSTSVGLVAEEQDLDLSVEIVLELNRTN